MSDTTYFPLPGDSIQDACVSLVNIARATGRPAEMLFNDVRIVADSQTKPDELVKDFARRIHYRASSWRVGSKNRLNVYEGERSVCQCHSPDDACLIVRAMNAYNAQRAGTSDQREIDKTEETK
jgi:hypothetical protein